MDLECKMNMHRQSCIVINVEVILNRENNLDNNTSYWNSVASRTKLLLAKKVIFVRL